MRESRSRTAGGIVEGVAEFAFRFLRTQMGQKVGGIGAYLPVLVE